MTHDLKAQLPFHFKMLQFIAQAIYIQSFIQISKLFPYASVTLSRIWQQMATRIWFFSNSALIVKASAHSWGHLQQSYGLFSRFLGFGSNFVCDDKIFGMPKKCRKATRMFPFVMHSCVHLSLRMPIVRSSFTIVFSSHTPREVIGAIGSISPHEDNTNNSRSFRLS